MSDMWNLVTDMAMDDILAEEGIRVPKRALRRHHRNRLKKKRAGHWGGGHDVKTLGMLVATATPCSCHMCGNARRIIGLKTRKEIPAYEDIHEMLHAIAIHQRRR